MNKAAIYLRISCSQQREASLEDQERRCRELAARLGLVVDEKHIYSDSAISGTEKAINKRTGYQQLLQAWAAGEIQFILADDWNRFTRDAVEQAQLVRKLENNQRVHIITNNGLDTRIQNWQLQVGLLGMVGQQQVRDTMNLVVRGMVGQLERGYMIAAPVLGYSMVKEYGKNGNPIGTRWIVNGSAAEIIKEIFQRRGDGQSLHQIARWLNDTGVPLQRKKMVPTGGYWRASRLNALLSNRIFRGEFVWHGSTAKRNSALKSGTDLKPVAYARPELRLVSDELWQRCNGKIISRSGYGGGKHPFSGLFKCNVCESVLVLSSKTKGRSMYCAQCTTAKAMGMTGNYLTSTVAIDGVKRLLQTAIRCFLSPAFVELFRSKLRAGLSGDHSEEIQALNAELKQCARAQDRISRMVMNMIEDDPVLMSRYDESKTRARDIETYLAQLKQAQSMDRETAAVAQLQVDPVQLLDKVFSADLPVEKLRSLLARLFPKLIFEGKPNSRYTSHFLIEFAMGNALALASDSSAVTSTNMTKRFALTYHPANANKIDDKWTVAELHPASQPKG